MNVKIYKKTGVSLHFIYRDAILISKQTKTKRHTKRQQICRLSSNADKIEFEDLQTDICVGLERCLWNPKYYGLNHSCMKLGLVWIHSL
jgi:hypothetical protein